MGTLRVRSDNFIFETKGDEFCCVLEASFGEHFPAMSVYGMRTQKKLLSNSAAA